MDDHFGIENVLHVSAYGISSLQKSGSFHIVDIFSFELNEENDGKKHTIFLLSFKFLWNVRHLQTSKIVLIRNEFASTMSKLSVCAGNIYSHIFHQAN